MAEPSKNKYLILTCDTEALPSAATEDHVDRLIWGRFPGQHSGAGIGLMMDVADEAGVKISFFFDVFERLKYGQEIDYAARYIVDRGHDLQLHLHIEFLTPEFWQAQGCYPVTWAMNLFDYRSATRLLEYGIDLFEQMSGRRPVAYRGGAFRYNSNILKALHDLGIPLSFHYYPSTIHKPTYPYGFDAGALPIFKWSNGLIEVPCGVYENPAPRKDKPRYKGFEFQEFQDLDHCKFLMDSYWRNGPEFQVLVMVLHSWSLLKREETGQFVWQGDRNVNLFREILTNLPPDVRVISAAELLTKIQEGEVRPHLEMPLCVAGTEGIPLFPLPSTASKELPKPGLLGASQQVARTVEAASR